MSTKHEPMADNNELTDEELNDLQEKLDIIASDLNQNPDRIELLRARPIAFLNEYRIKVLKYIRKSATLTRSMISSVRSFIKKVNGKIGSCVKCKIAVLLIMLGALGKVGLAWEAIVDGIDNIISALKKYFDKTREWFKEQFARLDKAIDGYKPADIAIKICRYLGYCVVRLEH